MAIVRLVGGVLTLIGAVLLIIVGIIYLTGFVPEGWLAGLTGLVLGIGLVGFSVPALKRG